MFETIITAIPINSNLTFKLTQNGYKALNIFHNQMISKNLEYIFLNLQFIKPTKTQLYYCQWQDPMCKKPKKKKKK